MFYLQCFFYKCLYSKTGAASRRGWCCFQTLILLLSVYHCWILTALWWYMSVWWNVSVWERGNVCVCVFISLTAGSVQRSCPPAVIWLWQSEGDMIVCSRSPHSKVWVCVRVVFVLSYVLSTSGVSSISTFLLFVPFLSSFMYPLSSPFSPLNVKGKLTVQSDAALYFQHYGNAYRPINSYQEHKLTHSHLLLPYTLLRLRPLTLARWAWRQINTEQKRPTKSKSDWHLDRKK